MAIPGGMLIYRILRTLHAWVGIALALLLIVVSASGSLLLWKWDYLRLTIPEARVSFEPTPENLARIAERVEVEFESQDLMAFYFPTENFSLATLAIYPDTYVYLDVEGNLVDQWQGNSRAEEWLFDLHHRLLLADTGLQIVGLGSMALFILMLSGVIVWWPTRRAFRMRLWPADSSREQALGVHRNLGILLALPFILVVGSGIILVYPQQSEELLLGEHRLTQEYSDKMTEGLDGIQGGNSGDWLPAFERALAVFPDAHIRSVQGSGLFSAYRVIGLQQEGEWNPLGMSKVYIDGAEGHMDIRMDSQAFPAIERAYNALYPLHTGRVDAFWYKCLLTLIGLGLTLMGFMGMLAFIRRYYRDTSPAG